MLKEGVNGFCMALADSVPGVSGGTVAWWRQTGRKQKPPDWKQEQRQVWNKEKSTFVAMIWRDTDWSCWCTAVRCQYVFDNGMG